MNIRQVLMINLHCSRCKNFMFSELGFPVPVSFSWKKQGYADSLLFNLLWLRQ